jgi:hypothetical protein
LDVGTRDSAETEVRRPAEKPGGKEGVLRWVEDEEVAAGGKEEWDGEEPVEELFSSSETEVRGVESTPKGPLVKSEFAAAVLSADPRRGWLAGGAGGVPLTAREVGEEGTWWLWLEDLKVDEEDREANRL